MLGTIQTFDVTAKWSENNPVQVYSGKMSLVYDKIYSLDCTFSVDGIEVFDFRGSFVLAKLDFKEVTYSTEMLLLIFYRFKVKIRNIL